MKKYLFLVSLFFFNLTEAHAETVAKERVEYGDSASVDLMTKDERLKSTDEALDLFGLKSARFHQGAATVASHPQALATEIEEIQSLLREGAQLRMETRQAFQYFDKTWRIKVDALNELKASGQKKSASSDKILAMVPANERLVMDEYIRLNQQLAGLRSALEVRRNAVKQREATRLAQSQASNSAPKPAADTHVGEP